MLSALVLVQSGTAESPTPEAVVRSLSALVPAAIEGIVRDVALASPERNDDLERIADHAGCAFIHAPADQLIGAALAGLKERRVLVLRGGRMPEHGYLGELADFMAHGADRCALMLEAPHNFITRIAPRLAPACAIIAGREHVRASGHADVRALARALPSPVVLKTRGHGAG